MVADRAAISNGLYMTEEQYLALDEATDGNYEFYDGYVVMLSPPSSAYDEHPIIDMAGGSIAHSALCARLASLIDRALPDGPCLVHTSDVKITSLRNYFHPDVSVACSEEPGQMLNNPVVVIEVLSPVTEKRDRGSKFQAYKEVLGETMITTTVRKALGHNVDGYTDSRGLLTGHKLYLIRDGDIVFYIGQSAQPLIRLQEHMGWTWQGNQSTIGKLIEDNAPESGKWTYELWRVEECEQYVTEYRVNTFPDSWQKLHPSYDIDEAEEALIKHFKPCLNSAMNPNPTPLPGRYIKYNRSQEHLNMLEKLFGISQEEGE